MKKNIFIFLIAVFSIGLFASESTVNFPKIDRRPGPVVAWWRWIKLFIPNYDPNSTNPWQVDLRMYNVSFLNLRNSYDKLIYASFDDRTVWPSSDRMPPNYDYKKIMELGKNPGLGVRSLHKMGITGKGVGIAIIDMPLLTDHREYVQNLRLYEEINMWEKAKSSMHGPAVASIAVGKTVGVAPDAYLYYIAVMAADGKKRQVNFKYYAQAINRILEINNKLPSDRKIRVISTSIGWTSTSKGYQQITEAAQKARQAGILVTCSSIDDIHGFKFQGLGRHPEANPDNFNSYEPGSWWSNQFYNPESFWAKQFYTRTSSPDRLLVPMDSRTTASLTGINEYAFCRQGGWSWSIPYIAGVYALAAQTDPNITPDKFWSLALKTGRTIELNHDGRKIPFGPILNPVGLINTLKTQSAEPLRN